MHVLSCLVLSVGLKQIPKALFLEYRHARTRTHGVHLGAIHAVSRLAHAAQAVPRVLLQGHGLPVRRLRANRNHLCPAPNPLSVLCDAVYRAARV